MSWVILILLSAFFYGAYNFFLKVSSGSINQILGAVILQFVATLTGGAALVFLKLINAPLQFSSKGVTLAIFAGISVGLAEILSFYIFSKGISLSVGMPIIVGGSVLVGSALGIIFLKESLTLVQYFAIALVTAGISILLLRQ